MQDFLSLLPLKYRLKKLHFFTQLLHTLPVANAATWLLPVPPFHCDCMLTLFTLQMFVLLLLLLVCGMNDVVSQCYSAQYLYWAAQDIPDNPSKRINNVEFLYERQFHPNVGNAVSATSYALLCYLAHNNMTYAVPIMKFITSQRNYLMGWSSTSVRSFLSYVSFERVLQENICI